MQLDWPVPDPLTKIGQQQVYLAVVFSQDVG